MAGKVSFARSWLTSPRRIAALVLILGSALLASGAAVAAVPGDTLSVVTLQANFDADSPNSPPDASLPGAPTGDFLSLTTAGGTVKVVPSYDGLSRPVEIRQLNAPGGVALDAHPASTPAPAEKVTVRWSSVAKDDEALILMDFAVRASNGATLASIEYLHQGGLSYNGFNGGGQVLPVTQPNKLAQRFAIDVNFLSRTTSLSIDGTPVPGFQSVPFAEAGDDVAFLSCNGQGLHPQTMYVDDISMVATYRNPDRAPLITAPAVADGEEGGILDFEVTASDPDADAITSLSADLSILPAGHSATFTPAPNNLSGTFHWPMKRGEAGAYDVAFTASNVFSATATTKVNVAFAGTSVTGELIWTPQPGQEGTYVVTFTATNALNETGTGTTTILVTPPLSATTGASQAATPDRRGVSLSPERALKGPIVSVVGLTSAPSGKQTTVSATASDPGTSLLAASLRRVHGAASAANAASGIVTFDADLSGLPTGNNAIWTIDEDPIVTAPASFTVDPGTPLSFNVGASDPDGDAILGLSANLTVLPSGNTATFTPNGTFTSGAFAWTPRPEDIGTFAVEFTAFNALVGTTTTTITVRAIAPARVYTTGPKKIRLSSNKAFGCMQLEPVNESFSLLDIDLATLKMISYGTGSVSEILAKGMKSVVIGDRDNNQIQDMQICFEKGDLRNLFSNLRGPNSVPVVIQGSLITGGRFQGTVTLDIIAGGGPLQTVMSPNPLNPAGKLTFITRTPGAVRVALYDLNGRLVRTLMRQDGVAAGAHEISFEARGSDGQALSSGVYFYRIESRDGTDTGRFTILK